MIDEINIKLDILKGTAFDFNVSSDTMPTLEAAYQLKRIADSLEIIEKKLGK